MLLLYDWITLVNDLENEDFEIDKDCFEIEKELNTWYDDVINKLVNVSDNRVAFNPKIPIHTNQQLIKKMKENKDRMTKLIKLTFTLNSFRNLSSELQILKQFKGSENWVQKQNET